MELVTRPHARNLVRFSADKPRIVVLSADLTASCEADDFRDSYPDRFLSMGMAEQNMVSFAGGMAREGFFPHIHTFAVFICRRAFDQLAMSVAYPNLPVRFCGFLPGITTPGGVTHQAVDDLALMRALPNMTVLECGDATDVESVLDVAHAIPGPVYIRCLRGQVPRLFPADEPMRAGHARVLRHGASPDAVARESGCDVTLLTSGVCTEEGIRAAIALRKRGVSVDHLHVSTLKPFCDARVDAALTSAAKGAVVLENHSVIGGLGSAVAERMAELGCGRKLVRLGLKDVYAHGASKGYLMRKYGLDAGAVVRAVEELLGKRLGICEDELTALDPAPAGPRSGGCGRNGEVVLGSLPSVKAEDL
ncbi:MAG: transketolase [Deltaproteobacteria bacterium]|nr:transketolase [Deltaproteobacteria bacterium]